MAGSRWKRVGGLVAGVAAITMFFALKALGQFDPPAAPPVPRPYAEPGYFPAMPDSQPLRQGYPPDGGIEDPNVQPAQFVFPSGMAGGYAAPARAVTDPPPPVVKIQVRVAADSPPGDDIKYVITVQNTSAADAHGVLVRNPLGDSIAQALRADPPWDANKSVVSEAGRRQLVWSFGTLPGGRTKTIELTLRPKPDATDVKNLAYVQFEHGEAVTTRISKPSLKVSKTASKQAVRDEPYLVRVTVENDGRVAAEDVRVTENVPAATEFEPVTAGAKRTTQDSGQQWVWEFVRLLPGERRVVEFRITARSEAEALTLTHVSAAKGVQERAEARTKVLVPGLSVKLSGPAGVIGPGESALYEITVRNPGTLAGTNVQVTGVIPTDCKATMKTEGGQLRGDAVQWTVPRLEPGAAQSFRFRLKALTTGNRTVAAAATDSRNQKAGDKVSTMFQGAPALAWESGANPPALTVGRSGEFTIKVRNNGGEAARNVQLQVELDRPDAVLLGRATPATIALPTTVPNARVVFEPEIIPARGEITYRIPFEARQPAQIWFKLKLTAEYLGDRPMQTEKAVEITGQPK